MTALTRIALLSVLISLAGCATNNLARLAEPYRAGCSTPSDLTAT